MSYVYIFAWLQIFVVFASSSMLTCISFRVTQMSEQLLVSSISPPDPKNKRQKSEIRVLKCRRCLFNLPPSAGPNLYVIQTQSSTQPQLAELLSSNRAQALISRQLHALQVSPDEAMDADQLKAACGFIKQHYPDLPLVVSI